MEHYEAGSLTRGKLKWSVGTNWPADPKVWTEANALPREGKQHESVDSWDVTSSVDTPERLRMLQLQIRNDDTGSQKKTFVDQVYTIIEWDLGAPVQQKSVEPDTELIRYGQGGS